MDYQEHEEPEKSAESSHTSETIFKFNRSHELYFNHAPDILTKEDYKIILKEIPLYIFNDAHINRFCPLFGPGGVKPYVDNIMSTIDKAYYSDAFKRITHEYAYHGGARNTKGIYYTEYINNRSKYAKIAYLINKINYVNLHKKHHKTS
jgi:hypothetical protein